MLQQSQTPSPPGGEGWGEGGFLLLKHSTGFDISLWRTSLTLC
jgi:hypothetical protein